jgi:Flp pilus assembly protein TadG
MAKTPSQATYASPRRATPRRALASRRGAIGAAFAVASIGVLGLVGLATEGGLWYMARRNAQTAVDTGAFAGAAQLAWRGTAEAGRNAALAAGRAQVALNGFATEATRPTTVTITLCRWNGTTCTPDNATPNAVQADIEQLQTTGLVRLISATPPTMRATAIATVEDIGQACMLSLTGVAQFVGSATVKAPDCAVVSNRATGQGVDCGNASDLEFRSIRAVGSVSGVCDGLGVPIAPFAPPATDPYVHLRNAATWMPTFSTQGQAGQGQNQCQVQTLDATNSIYRTENGIRTYRPRPYNSSGTYTTQTAICSDIQVSNASEQMILVPGTYFFHGADLKITGGNVTCDCPNPGDGVTLVFTGRDQGQNSFGSAQITGGTVSLRAPSSGPWYTNPNAVPLDPATGQAAGATFEGMLIYRDDRAGPNNSKQLDQFNTPNTVQLAGNADAVNLDGGVYLPTSQLTLVGTSATQTNQSDCQSMVAATIQVSGTADFELGLQGCEDLGTTTSRSYIVRLVR